MKGAWTSLLGCIARDGCGGGGQLKAFGADDRDPGRDPDPGSRKCLPGTEHAPWGSGCHHWEWRRCAFVAGGAAVTSTPGRSVGL